MNTIFLLFAFNVTVEGLRVYNPDYYRIKEVKVQKCEAKNKVCCSIVNRGSK